MARFAIICEYNPLHAGHVYCMERARQAGADALLCIMSGNFTQRGEPAMAHKYIRAKAAIACGADLVVELPFPHACAGAEYFASAGVCTADALGTEVLFFGSESGDIDRLQAAAKVAVSPEFSIAYQDLIKTNLGTAAAYTKALEQVLGQPFSALSNDLLGLSYCKAILSGSFDITPMCTPRIGSGYNDQVLSDQFPSATALRKLRQQSGLDSLEDHIPNACFAALSEADKKGELLGNTTAYDTALLAILRTTPVTLITDSALCSGGLGERIARAAQNATNLAQLYTLCAHKSLPDAHVRRAVLYAALGITEKDLRTPPAYLNVLAANTTGREVLSDLRRTCPVPLVTKPADAPECRQRVLSDRADALYTLAMQAPQSAGFFKRQSPFMAE